MSNDTHDASVPSQSASLVAQGGDTWSWVSVAITVPTEVQCGPTVYSLMIRYNTRTSTNVGTPLPRDAFISNPNKPVDVVSTATSFGLLMYATVREQQLQRRT